MKHRDVIDSAIIRVGYGADIEDIRKELQGKPEYSEETIANIIRLVQFEVNREGKEEKS